MLLLCVTDPSIGGVLVMGHRGTGKSTAVRALAALLPPIERVAFCPYQCDPVAPSPVWPHGSTQDAIGETTTFPVPMVDLPLGATEDRVVGSLDGYHERPSSELLTDIQTQAGQLGIQVEAHANGHSLEQNCISALNHELIQVEQRMIPLGLHILGEAPAEAELTDMLYLVAAFNAVQHPPREQKLPVLPVLIARGPGWNFDELQ